MSLDPYGRIAVKVDTAGALTEFSRDTIVRAIHATDPNAFPPPLKAKTTPRGFRIIMRDLEAWVDSLPDA